MRCIVTGGAGFIGSHLVDALIERGYKVLIIDDLSTGKEENINKKAEFEKIKIEDEKIFDILKKFKPDAVFHFAAQIDVRKSVKDPLFDTKVNVLGTVNLLKASADCKVKSFIFASSGGVIYGDVFEPAKENHPVNPQCPYGIAKLSGEYYVKFFGKEYSFKWGILRFANVYGPRQDPKGEAGVCAIFIGNMMKKRPCKLYGYGKLVRDYIYVEDAVSLTLQVFDKGVCDIFNAGTGKGTSVIELFNILKEFFDYNIEPILEEKRPGELESNILSYEKAKILLNWKPKYSLKEGLKKTIEWFKRRC